MHGLKIRNLSRVIAKNLREWLASLVVNLLPFDGEAYLYENFLSIQEASQLYSQLQKEVEWQKDALIMFGKKIMMNREVALFGEPGLVYRYSGVDKMAVAWTHELEVLRNRLTTVTPIEFNVCLLNHYLSGGDGMGWHSDDEKALGTNPVIASLSLGANRIFSFKHKQTGEEIRTLLNHGSLLIMKGEIQHCWKHALPKDKNQTGGRINLTFRKLTK